MRKEFIEVESKKKKHPSRINLLIQTFNKLQEHINKIMSMAKGFREKDKVVASSKPKEANASKKK